MLFEASTENMFSIETLIAAASSTTFWITKKLFEEMFLSPCKSIISRGQSTA